MEIWKDIKGFEGYYQISNLGRIRSLDRIIEMKNGKTRKVKGKILKQSTSVHGYKVVCFRRNGKKENFRVHRLIGEAFIDNQDNKPFINHIDGDKSNNDISNLEWCTAKENANHAYEFGLKEASNPNKNGLKQGSKHHNSKLTEKEVKFMRENSRKNGGSFKNAELAKLFGITKANVSHIVNGKGWKHIS